MPIKFGGATPASPVPVPLASLPCRGPRPVATGRQGRPVDPPQARQESPLTASLLRTRGESTPRHALRLYPVKRLPTEKRTGNSQSAEEIAAQQVIQTLRGPPTRRERCQPCHSVVCGCGPTGRQAPQPRLDRSASFKPWHNSSRQGGGAGTSTTSSAAPISPGMVTGLEAGGLLSMPPVCGSSRR